MEAEFDKTHHIIEKMYPLESVRHLVVEQSQLCYILFGAVLAYAGWRWVLRLDILNGVITDLMSNLLNVRSKPRLIHLHVSESSSNEDSTISPDGIPSTTPKRASKFPGGPTAGPTDRVIRANSSTASRTGLSGQRSMDGFTASGRARRQKCRRSAPQSTAARTDMLHSAFFRRLNI